MWTVSVSYGKKDLARLRKILQAKAASTGRSYGRATINVLPNEALLEAFDFYLDEAYRYRVLNAWLTLIHVCRRWQQVVFTSLCRLNLRLLCSGNGSVWRLLDNWPELPIVVQAKNPMMGVKGIVNIGAAIQRKDRVCKLDVLYVPNLLLNQIASIKEPLPSLTSLTLGSIEDGAPALPDSFLDGSAPHLRNLRLHGISYPGLPNLLLSAHHLDRLWLEDIPDSGLNSPEAMVTCLSSLANLEEFHLVFRSPRSRPHQASRRPPPLTLTVLPSLTSLWFRGVSEYLEDIVARIDVPLLDHIDISFFNQLVLDTPLLRSFISRTEAFKGVHRAEIRFRDHVAQVELLREEPRGYWSDLEWDILCTPWDWQLSSLAQFCNLSLPPLPTLEHLSISGHQRACWKDDDMEEDTQYWLELLHPFITVKSLYVEEDIAPRVAVALQGLAGERVADVLPALQNIFVRGPLKPFITARQLFGHPVAVHEWPAGIVYVNTGETNK